MFSVPLTKVNSYRGAFSAVRDVSGTVVEVLYVVLVSFVSVAGVVVYCVLAGFSISFLGL